MNTKGRESAQKLLAMVVIIAMLGVMGIPISIMVFFAVVIYFIWRTVGRSDPKDTRRIFEFYIAAYDILRDEDRRWFGFEIAEVIESGEQVVYSMPDPPPLVYFALGVLYHHAGDHQAAVEHLSYIVDNELSDERHRHSPSPELKRYAYILRKLEREPSEAPQTIGAIRGLERTRRIFGAALLDGSRKRVNIIPTLYSGRGNFRTDGQTCAGAAAPMTVLNASGNEVMSHKPITDVLRDVYDEEKQSA